jgi:hypothetical protein
MPDASPTSPQFYDGSQLSAGYAPSTSSGFPFQSSIPPGAIAVSAPVYSEGQQVGFHELSGTMPQPQYPPTGTHELPTVTSRQTQHAQEVPFQQAVQPQYQTYQYP